MVGFQRPLQRPRRHAVGVPVVVDVVFVLVRPSYTEHYVGFFFL